MQSSLNFVYKVASNRSNAAKYAKLNNNYKSISNVLIFLHLMYLGTIHVCCSNLGVFHRLVYISIDFETNGDQPENLTIIEHNINSFISVFYLNTNCIFVYRKPSLSVWYWTSILCWPFLTGGHFEFLFN